MNLTISFILLESPSNFLHLHPTNSHLLPHPIPQPLIIWAHHQKVVHCFLCAPTSRARVGIRSGQSDFPTRVRPRFLGHGHGRTQRCVHDLGHGSGSVSSTLIVGRIILCQTRSPRFVRWDRRLSRRGRLFNMKLDQGPIDQINAAILPHFTISPGLLP